MNFKIDWLEWTEFSNEGALSPVNWLITSYASDGDVVGKGRFGYKHKRVMLDGALTIYSADTENAARMGVHCVMTGAFSEKTNTPLHGVAKWLSSYEGKRHFTRIDLACDLSGADITARDVGGRCKDAMLEGIIRRRKWTEYTGDDGGYTYYSGSRASDVMMRCYDKGIETGLYAANQWTRIEFELKGNTARDLGAIWGSKSEHRIWEISAEYFYGLLLQHCPRSVAKLSGIEEWGLQPRAIDKTRGDSDPDFWLMNTVVAGFSKRLATCLTDQEKSDFVELWARTIYTRVGKQNARIITDSFMRALKRK